METETVESANESTAIEHTEVTVPQSTSEITLSTTTTDKLSEELVKPQISLKLGAAGDSESVSPENSITSSDNSGELRTDLNILVEAQPSDESVKVVDNSLKETETDQEDQNVSKPDENVEKDDPEVVDSTTPAVEEDNIEGKVSKSPENESNEVEISKELPSEDNSSETSPDTQSSECDSLDSSDVNETSVKTDVPTPTIPSEEPKISETTEAAEQLEDKIEEPVETKVEEVSSLSEEKEIPMEVDAEQEETSDVKAKEETLVKEPESTEIPEIP